MRKCLCGVVGTGGLFFVVSLLAFAQPREGVTADVPVPKDLKSIGGKWFVSGGDKPVYNYRDGERLVDLFSYHQKDSNKDGIENLRLSHDDKFLIMQSQGYPNHPTAVFPNSGNPHSIRVQNFTFRLPLEPKLADKITRVPMGAIGLTANRRLRGRAEPRGWVILRTRQSVAASRALRGGVRLAERRLSVLPGCVRDRLRH